jgi:FtsZ-interacting cell division protein ZipA
MSTVAIIAIVVGALILLAIVTSVVQRSRARQQIGEAQVEAQHDDVRHHRDQAEQRRSEAALSEERARRAEAEAELDEKRAAEREKELEN